MPRKRILYVDDDESTLTIVSKFLISAGYEVETTTTPFIAPLLTSKRPDLIILDINMPLLSGDRIADILANQGYSDTAHLIFFSGEAPEKARRIATRHPGAAYVSKQSGLDSLLRQVEIMLR
jgi:CheY-like chemotaxis protein